MFHCTCAFIITQAHMSRERKPSILAGCNLFKLSLTSSDKFSGNDRVSVRIGADLKSYAKGTCSGFTTSQCVFHNCSGDRNEEVYLIAVSHSYLHGVANLTTEVLYKHWPSCTWCDHGSWLLITFLLIGGLFVLAACVLTIRRLFWRFPFPNLSDY